MAMLGWRISATGRQCTTTPKLSSCAAVREEWPPGYPKATRVVPKKPSGLSIISLSACGNSLTKGIRSVDSSSRLQPIFSRSQCAKLPTLPNPGILQRSLFGRSIVGRPWSLGPCAALKILILVTFALRLIWSAAMEVGNDEAYHYLFTVHPALSYFDHPPMTMWIEWLGIQLCGGWVHPFSLRLGFVFLITGSTWVMARLTARWYGEWAGFFAALFLNVTLYYGGAGGFALPDPPFLFFGLLTIGAFGEALIAQPTRARPWVWVGLAFGGALLSKYHAILLPAGALLYIAVSPGTRHILLRPGPYLAVAIGFLCFSPVLIWNAEHHWASFLFQGNRAAATRLQIQGLVATVLGPIGYLLPWIWYLLVWALVGGLRRFRSLEGMDRLLICLAVVPLAFFLAISFVNKMLPHWSLIGFAALFPLAGAQWAERSASNPIGARKRVIFMVGFVLILAGMSLLQVRTGLLKLPFRDPFVEMSGWESVGDELRARGFIREPKTFVMTNSWYESGQIAFAVRNEIPVLCYDADSHGFAYWSNPAEWLGWDGLYITTNNDRPWEIQLLGKYFKRIRKGSRIPDDSRWDAIPHGLCLACIDQAAPFPYRKPGQ